MLHNYDKQSLGKNNIKKYNSKMEETRRRGEFIRWEW